MSNNALNILIDDMPFGVRCYSEIESEIIVSPSSLRNYSYDDYFSSRMKNNRQAIRRLFNELVLNLGGAVDYDDVYESIYAYNCERYQELAVLSAAEEFSLDGRDILESEDEEIRGAISRHREEIEESFGGWGAVDEDESIMDFLQDNKISLTAKQNTCDYSSIFHDLDEFSKDLIVNPMQRVLFTDMLATVSVDDKSVINFGDVGMVYDTRGISDERMYIG